jgi:hypothetical protein
MGLFERVVVGLLLFSTCSARAEALSAKLRADVEARGRERVQDLFRALCPEQCVLVSLQARVEDEEVGGAVPGFEAPGERTAPALRSTSAALVLDNKLAPSFRSRVKDLVAQRLRELGADARVTAELVPFPPRNPPHLEAPPAAPVPPPAPTPAASRETPAPERNAPAALSAPAPLSLDRVATDRLAEHAPLLVVVSLLGAALLALGALMLVAVRRATAAADPFPAGLGFDAAGEPLEPASPALAVPALRTRKLDRALRVERALRNDVVRGALERGEATLVARWARELGEFLLEDVRGDEAFSAQLAAVAAELARPADAAAQAAALADLEGRVLAARLTTPAGDADQAFAFLEGVRTEAFAAACAGLTPGALEVVLRFAPSRLRTAALRALPADRRDEVALSWARRPELPSGEVSAAAGELRSRLQRAAGGHGQAERALADLLEGLDRAAQDALVARLCKEGDGTLGVGLITESSLLSAPPEALTAAVSALPAERLLAYLGSAEAALRNRVLLACPKRLAVELREELSLRGPRRDGFPAARAALLANLREALSHGSPVAAE